VREVIDRVDAARPGEQRAADLAPGRISVRVKNPSTTVKARSGYFGG